MTNCDAYKFHYFANAKNTANQIPITDIKPNTKNQFSKNQSFITTSLILFSTLMFLWCKFTKFINNY